VSINEEVLKASQELYEMRVAKYGEGNEYTITAGKIYAGHLQKVNRGEDARRLLMKLSATSKQVLGPHHTMLPRRLNQSSKFLVLITVPQWWVKMRLNVTEHTFSIGDV
jgi:hypothetical protein